MFAALGATYRPMRSLAFVLSLAAACGGDDDVGVDAGFDGSSPDATGFDASFDASFDAGLDAPSADAGADAAIGMDAAPLPEDCGTELDEDGNGYAGCADPTCWGESRCVEAELATNGAAGWMPCADPIELDDEATTEVCDAGLPFPTERDFDCGRVPTTMRLDLFCEPGDGPGRALRYRVRMDTTSVSEMLGPMTVRNTSFSAELGFFGSLYVAGARGASSGEDPIPTHQAWLTNETHATAWVITETPAQVIVLLGASSQTSTLTIHEDGSVTGDTGDPVYFLTAGLDTRF